MDGMEWTYSEFSSTDAKRREAVPGHYFLVHDTSQCWPGSRIGPAANPNLEVSSFNWLELCTHRGHFFGAAADETPMIPMVNSTMTVMTTPNGFETGPFSHGIRGHGSCPQP
ncbi:hypothetical protein NW759_17760 [Fusarium solani]|jgi:hypothetical protein|nr:hypothetical protein NW759_17760 [Fusarium solani]